MNLQNYKTHLMVVKWGIRIIQRLLSLLIHSHYRSLLLHPHTYPIQKSSDTWNNNAIWNGRNHFLSKRRHRANICRDYQKCQISSGLFATDKCKRRRINHCISKENVYKIHLRSYISSDNIYS